MDYKKIKRGISIIGTAYYFWEFQASYYDDIEFFKYLPWWIAGPLFFVAICLIQKEIPETKLLKPLCIVMGLLDLSVWLIEIFEIKIPFELYILQILSSVISLYFNYQLLTNIFQFATKCGYEKTNEIKICRNLQTIYVTAFTLLLPFYEEIAVNNLVLYFGWFCIIYIIYSITSFEKYLKDLQKEEKKKQVL